MDEEKIFSEGEVVGNIGLPDEFGSNAKKKLWGVKALGEFLSKLYGRKIGKEVIPSMSYDRLTGTKVIIYQNGKKVTFMLVEPLKNVNNEVLVVKKVDNLDAGDDIDYMDYRFNNQGRQARQSLNRPFDKLAQLLKKRQ